MTDFPPIDKDEWLQRYRQRFIDKANMSLDQANAVLDATTFEEASQSFENDPEGAADEEMSYWDDDGDDIEEPDDDNDDWDEEEDEEEEDE